MRLNVNRPVSPGGCHVTLTLLPSSLRPGPLSLSSLSAADSVRSVKISPKSRLSVPRTLSTAAHRLQQLRSHSSSTLASSKPTHANANPTKNITSSTTSPLHRTLQITRQFKGVSYYPQQQQIPQQSPESIESDSVSSTMASQFQVRKIGAANTLEHRVYIEKDGVPVSPFHDIPLFADKENGIYNMIVEIPRWTNAKQEVWKPLSCRCSRCKRPRNQLLTLFFHRSPRMSTLHQASD